MNTLSHQVRRLAAEGQILEMASAIVVAEQDRLLRYGSRRARWMPMKGTRFSKALAFNEVDLGVQPRIKGEHFVTALICAAEFQLGDDEEEFAGGFVIDEANEDILRNDEWCMEVAHSFAEIYASAEDVQNRPPVLLWPRMPQEYTQPRPSAMPLIGVTDHRRVQVTSSFFTDKITG